MISTGAVDRAWSWESVFFFYAPNHQNNFSYIVLSSFYKLEKFWAKRDFNDSQLNHLTVFMKNLISSGLVELRGGTDSTGRARIMIQFSDS